MATSATQGIPNNKSYGTPVQLPVQTMSADGAITLLAGGIVEVTKSGVCAMTLALPAGDGYLLFISSKTANAHTLTIAGGLHGLGDSENVGTFGGAPDDGIVLASINGYWVQVANVNVTVA